MSATDLAKMTRLGSVISSIGLNAVLEEVNSVIPKVTKWTQVPTSVSAGCFYAPTGDRTYEVRYQFGDMGNLVHELTHIAVNEAYGLDFINYPNEGATNVPPRQLIAGGICVNEAARQDALRIPAKELQLSAELLGLSTWVNMSDLSDIQKKQINDKLTYGATWASKENDTVLNQILVWLFEWGLPRKIGKGERKPIVNALYEEVERAALRAYRSRRFGQTKQYP